jgi:hypothetical protein
MKPFIITTLFLISVIFTNCGQNLESSDSKHHTAQVPPSASDLVEIPEINASVGIETGEVTIVWKSCDNAIGYELEIMNIGGGWELIYSGTNLSYYVGVIPDGESMSFRVRAIYSNAASNWSKVLTV